MALALGLVGLAIVVAIFLIVTAWGSRILTLVRCRSDDALESLLFAAAFSFATLEVVLFFLSVLNLFTRSFVIVLFILLGITAWSGWKELWNNIGSLCKRFPAVLENIVDRVLILLAAVVLTLEGLLAMAPLSGSDAMHYHFTVPFLEEGKPLEPLFGVVHSFVTGQAHLLISLGIVLGSDRLSLGLIYLGGVLAAAAVYVLSRHLMPRRWSLAAVLIFVSAPIVCWQIGTSGSPDIWMVFFVTVTVLAAARAELTSNDRWFILASFFAGAAAGAKYTGWILPFTLVFYILWQRRSVKIAFLGSVVSLVGGVWPIARNYLWTGDPVFPFLHAVACAESRQLVRAASASLGNRRQGTSRPHPHARLSLGDDAEWQRARTRSIIRAADTCAGPVASIRTLEETSRQDRGRPLGYHVFVNSSDFADGAVFIARIRLESGAGSVRNCASLRSRFAAGQGRDRRNGNRVPAVCPGLGRGLRQHLPRCSPRPGKPANLS
jgi:hypothetical protein